MTVLGMFDQIGDGSRRAHLVYGIKTCHGDALNNLFIFGACREISKGSYSPRASAREPHCHGSYLPRVSVRASLLPRG